MPGILEGIRIVDMTVWGVGPGGSAFLSDLGADVIHVEQLGVGDPMRGSHTFLGTNLVLPGDRQMWFETANRNKRAIAIDARKPEGKQVMYDLVAKSDVFVSNLRGESLKKLGLDYESLEKINPKLVYLHSTGFGSKGPAAKTPSYDLMGQARSGLMSTMGDPDKPQSAAAGLVDSTAAIMVSYGVLAALVARERHGIGQLVESSQLGATMAANFLPITVNLLAREEFGGQLREKARNPIWNWYRCKDGRWIAIGCIQGDRHWSPFCGAVGIKELEEDPRFENSAKRAENCEELISILDQVFATKTAEEWEKILMEADLVATRINKMQDLASDPQILENEFIIDFDHPVLGPIQMFGHPIKYTKTPATLRTAAPDYAQHTEEVLLEVCGYDWEKIAELKEKEVI